MRERFSRYLLAVGLVAGSLLLVGCGGGGEQGQQNDQSEGSQGEQTAQNDQYEEATGKEDATQAAPSWGLFKGSVTSILPDRDNLTVKRKNGTAKTFTYKPDRVRVKLGGEKVELDAIEKGQLVTINHVRTATKENIAHSIRIRSKKS
ncbi:MAG TPA: hypothetical protein VFR69_03550, partial [Rubrobacteraceae bacterium]|nr:hypothetical protein [Rubrobacteraceae bacterium]